MIDVDFLNQNNINPENVLQIQEEIMNSIRQNQFTELNNKYEHDILEHLCNDLVEQGKLGRVAKTTSSGIQFPYVLL